MTCKDLGGPCDLALQGDTADDVIKAQDRHLKEAVDGGDTSHAEARNAMKGRGSTRRSRWIGTTQPRRHSQLFQRTSTDTRTPRSLLSGGERGVRALRNQAHFCVRYDLNWSSETAFDNRSPAPAFLLLAAEITD